MIRWAILLACGLTATAINASDDDCDSRHFCTRVEVDTDGARLIGENLNRHVPITVKVLLASSGDDLRNDGADDSLPAIVVKPGAEQVLTRLNQDATAPDVDWVFGDHRATPDPDRPHLLPWPPDLFLGTLRYFVSQGCNGDFSHEGNRANATDFQMPEGARVSAVRGGVVFEVVEGFDKGGEDEALADAANVVQILHEDGSISMYAHLKKDGALVDEGDRVIAGDVIGLSGNTGFSTGAHLHFERYIAGDEGFLISLPTKFRHWGGEVTCPRTGSSMGAK